MLFYCQQLQFNETFNVVLTPIKKATSRMSAKNIKAEQRPRPLFPVSFA